MSDINSIVFHLTPTRNIDRIFKEGILPAIGKRSLQALETKEVSYHFSSIDALEDGLMNWYGDEFDEEDALSYESLGLIAVNISDRVDAEITLGAEFETTLSKVIPVNNLCLIAQSIDEVANIRSLIDSVLKSNPFFAESALSKAKRCVVEANIDFKEVKKNYIKYDADSYFKRIERLADSEEKLVLELIKIPDKKFSFKGLTSNGQTLYLTSSAKETNHWQLSWFNSEGLPWSDAQFETKKEALQDFLFSVELNSITDVENKLLLTSENDCWRQKIKNQTRQRLNSKTKCDFSC